MSRRNPSRNPFKRVDARVWALRAWFRTVGTVAPSFAARQAEAIFCRPLPHPFRAHEEEFLATGTRVDVRHAGGALAAWTWGEGPTVLCVHGWGSRASRFRVLVPALLARGFRVVAYDNPAHGASPGRHSSLPQFMAALLDVASALGPVHAAVGHSLGGAAVALAMREGLAVQRAVLLAPPANPSAFSQAFRDFLHLPTGVFETMRSNLEHRFGRRWEEFDVAGAAPGMSVPLLVVHDEDDPDVPLADGRAIADAWPGARFHGTSGLGHHTIMRDPSIAELVATFLAGG